MAIINRETRELHCKIVYYGPGMAGKTSNMQYIYSRTPRADRGDLLSIATETERTLFFEFTPPDRPQVRGRAVRFHLYTVPGCVLYERTKVKVLQGVDGIVFVADSQRDRMQHNIRSLQELVRGLYRHGRSIEEVPVVLQYNKRDIPNALPVAVMDTYLNPLGWRRFESIVCSAEEGSWQQRGIGVAETFDAIEALVLAKLAG